MQITLLTTAFITVQCIPIPVTYAPITRGKAHKRLKILNVLKTNNSPMKNKRLDRGIPPTRPFVALESVPVNVRGSFSF